MNNSIEQFLQEIHNLDDSKIDQAQLTKKLETLMSAKPNISADDAFKHKLRTRLNNIIEFKQSNAGVKKIGYLKILFSVFACFVFIVGIFSIIDINFGGKDTTYIAEKIAEPQTIIDTSLPPVEIATQIAQEEKKQQALTQKEKILAKAKEKKLAQQAGIQQDPMSDETVFGEQKNDTVQRELAEVLPTETEAAALIEENNTDAITQDIEINTVIEENNSGEDVKNIAEDNTIAIEIFTQSCEAFQGVINTQSDSMMCVKNERNICSRVDYEDGKCDFLE